MKELFSKRFPILLFILLCFAVFSAPVMAQEAAPSPAELIITQALVPAPAAIEPFTDVPEDSAYYVPVQFLREKGVIQGYGDGTFRPRELVKRVEALSMILKSSVSLPSEELTDIQQFNLPVDTILNLSFPSETNITIKTPSMETPIQLERTGVLELIMPNGGILRSGRIFLDQAPKFTDVNPKDWFFSLVQRATSLDITKGYPDGTFRPENTANLAEALALLIRTHRIVLDPVDPNSSLGVEDVPGYEWFAPHMAYALLKTIVIPNFQNHVQPEKEMTRGEIATLLYRFIRSQQNIKFGRASWYADGLSSIKVKTNAEYQEQNLTAAHKELPFGTLVRVKNLKNGKTVMVVINDRGPYMPGRIVDLSKTAFAQIAPSNIGVIPVEIEVLSPP